MSIIINDFEVVAPPSADQRPANAQSPEEREQDVAPLQPEDIERIIARFVQRRRRLWAD
ncbi:MAG: hypothetical protein KF893_09195 [Caldilineaceae bacterium]|nr:hypothetical protein [Caldilineaceae bacterium]